MRKISLFLTAAAVTGVMLNGCGSKETSFSPSATCVYIAEDGKISSALVESYEGEVDTEDLKKYLQAAVITYNQENGAEGKSENKPGTEERLPAALANLEKTDSAIKVVFDYASAEDLIRFRQTETNEDNSNTITALEVKPASEATDWFLAEDFTKADGSTVSLEEMKKNSEGMAVCIEGGGTIQFAGKVNFLALDAEVKDEYTVTVPDGGKAYVVFK